MKAKSSIILIVGAVLIIAGIFLYRSRSSVVSNATDMSDQSVSITPEQQQEVARDKAAVVSAPAAALYTHPRLGFSFQKPNGYTVGSLKNPDGSETLVVQPQSGQAHEGFQIYITPLDSPLEITPAQIQKDLPGTAINNPQKIVLDTIGTGMMFGSNNQAFGGNSFEIWFTVHDYLYQISSYGAFARELQQIIGTWKFQK